MAKPKKADSGSLFVYGPMEVCCNVPIRIKEGHEWKCHSWKEKVKVKMEERNEEASR